jgi:transcription termination factor Rho
MTPPREVVRIDYAALPADLSTEEIDALVAALPAPKKKTKPKPARHAELQAMTVADLHELADGEKIELSGSRQRRDILWDIARHRLLSHVPVVVEGLFDTGPESHAFLRSNANDYLPATDDVFVPPSVVKAYHLQPGMTVVGRVRPPREEERYLALTEIETIDGKAPEDIESRSPFKELVPLYPEERVLLEGTTDNPLEMRIVDLITPIGRGGCQAVDRAHQDAVQQRFDKT